jgi:hypothetical protein
MAAASPLPPGVPSFDAHVHLHPPGLARAIERWFAAHDWAPGTASSPRGGRHAARARRSPFCFFSYAHKPGWRVSSTAGSARRRRRCRGPSRSGTLHPDDPDLDAGRQGEATEAPRAARASSSTTRCSASAGRSAAVRDLRARGGGRATCSCSTPGTMPYRDPFTGVEPVGACDGALPALRVCVAHMGASRAPSSWRCSERIPHLYSDTTMADVAAGLRATSAPTRPLCRTPS